MKVGDRVRVKAGTGPVVYGTDGRSKMIYWGEVVEVQQNLVAVQFPGYPHIRDYGNSEIAQVALGNKRRKVVGK